MVGKGGSRIPERWTDYVPLGRRMPGTRFIAFKVPLKKSFDQNLHPEERFSPRDLIKKIKEQKEELGLIIDLTYTTRYYGPEELPATLCYSKILTMGHEIPNRHTIFQFKCVVKKFLRDNRDNDKLIGVHCTHGLNRTGYLVCRYLIDVEGMEPNTAIELFNRARGHPIERPNYIQDLQKRSVKSTCGLKNLGSGPFREKAGATPNTKTQIARHHPHCSDQFPLAVPRLGRDGGGTVNAWKELPLDLGRTSEMGDGLWELRNQLGSRNSSSTKSRRRGARAPAQHQAPVPNHGAMKQRWPCSFAASSCRVSLPANQKRNGLYFPPQSPHLCLPQETQVGKKRRRRRRKPAVTA
ncbi:RNA/RNP complex-1-interacting phosphatase [Rhynochetos jubatus]